METRLIEVSVRGQEISCTVQHPYPRTNTVQYLHVHFDADAIWDPLKKIAVFRRSGTATVAVPLDETMMCEMPPQMMAVPGYNGPVTVHIGLIGVGEDGSRLTTGEVPVTVNPSCYTVGKTPHPPAPDVYEELLRLIREAAENDVEEIRAALDAYFAENPIDVSGKLDKNQGAANAGKVLGIGEDGEVVPVDAPTGNEGGIVEETDPTVPAWAKQPNKPAYTAEEVGALPKTTEIPTVPSNVSAFNNDAGYAKNSDLGKLAKKDEVAKSDLASDVQASLSRADTALQSYEETDPTVPAWAKASTKPKYTASEVGADASGTADSKVSAHNTSEASHNDIRLLISGLTARMNAIADSDDTTLDQLSEIVAYIKANKGLIDSITTDKVNVADIINNLTTSATNKPLSAKMGVELKALIDAIKIPTSLPASDVPSWAKEPTKPSYNKSEVGLGNVDNVQQYSPENPPPYPVISVNGKLGVVKLSAPDVGADASGTASSAVSAHNADTAAHADIRTEMARISSAKVDKSGISLGIASDGLIYIFADGTPVGTGIPQGQSGDVFGYVDENNTIVLNGNLADGTYSLKYEMENGNVVNIGNMVLDSNVYYSVTSTLTNCNINNSAKQIVEGGSYAATITAKDGYELKSVTVTMGGSPVSVSGGSISIANVTGNIVITAVAEEVKVAEPVTVDIALTDGIRIGSDGGDRTQAGYCATPHIDLTAIPKPCTIHLTKALWCHAGAQTSGMVRVYAKNAAGSALVADTTRTNVGGGYFTVVDNSGIGNDVTVTVTSGDVASIRFSGGWTISGVSDSDVSFAAANTKATLTYTPAS